MTTLLPRWDTKPRQSGCSEAKHLWGSTPVMVDSKGHASGEMVLRTVSKWLADEVYIVLIPSAPLHKSSSTSPPLSRWPPQSPRHCPLAAACCASHALSSCSPSHAATHSPHCCPPPACAPCKQRDRKPWTASIREDMRSERPADSLQ